jgi:sulfite reductase alpha subunit-like flavoprotein
VDALLSRLGADGARRVRVASVGSGLLPQHLDGPATELREILLRKVDVTSIPKKALVRLLADHCAAPDEADALYRLSSIKGKDNFRKQVHSESCPNASS